MKKIWILSILLICLFLVWCWNETYLAPWTVELRGQKNNTVEQQQQINEDNGQNVEEANQQAQQKQQEDDFAMKEKCHKYQSELDEKNKTYWYQYAQIFYSKLYNSCLVDTFDQWDLWLTFEIYDYFNGNPILNCITWFDTSKRDFFTYDDNVFDFSYEKWKTWICDMVHDWIFELAQNPSSEELSIYLKK